MFYYVLSEDGRLRLFFALLLLMLLLFYTSSVKAEITVPGQGVWLFDQDTGGTTVLDSSVYGRDGTRTANVTTSTDTPFEYSGNLSAEFDGTGGYITIPAEDGMLKEDSATAECWFKFSSGALQAGTHKIVGGKHYANNFMINQYGDTLYVYWKSVSPTVRLDGILGGMVDQWNHIAVTVNGTTVSVYLNGVFQESQVAGSNAFNLGAVNIGGSEIYPDRTINGLVDEVRFLDYPLSAGDIMANYQASLKKEHALPGIDRKLAMYQTEFSPAVLLHSTDKSIRLFQDMDAFGLGAPTYVSAVNSSDTVSVYQSGIDSIPADISESWLLVWFNGGSGWDNIQFIQKPDTAHGGWDGATESPEPVGEFDVPWLIVLQHRPDTISSGSSGMEISFEDSVGYVRMIPLYGIKRLDPAETSSWTGGLPSDVVQRARRWTGILQKYPVEMRETFSVDHSTDRINIRNEFEYLQIADDWGTAPTLIAPLPPTLGLIVRYGDDDNPSPGSGNHLVSFDQNLLDENYMTPYGPLYVIETSHKVEYSLKDQLKYADEVAYVTGTSNFDPATLDDLKSRLAEAVDSQYLNHYRRNGTYPPDCYDINGNPIEYTYFCYNSNGQWIMYYSNFYEWEAFDWMRLGLTSAAIAKLRPYLEVDQKNAVDLSLHLVLDEYLNPNNYIALRDDVRDIDYLVHEHRWNYKGQGWTDTHGYGGTLHSMYILANELGRMDEIDLDMVRKIWNGMQYQQWLNFPSVTLGDFLHSMIAGSWAMARIAAYVGDQENYDVGVYSGARFLLNRYATTRAIDYIKEMGQWAHWMDPDRDYFYLSTRSGDLDRLNWAFNTMGFKFFDAEVTQGFGWKHTFVIRLYEENMDRFFHDNAQTTAPQLLALINANKKSEAKLINGITTTSTISGHWESVGWQRDHRGDKVEVVMDLKDPVSGTSPAQDVSSITIRSLSRTGHGIYFPSNIQVYYWDEGTNNWQTFGSTSPVDEGVSDNTGNGAWHTFSVVSAQPVTTGQLKIETTLHTQWSNVTAYWFSDEIEVFDSGSEKVTTENIMAAPTANYDARNQDWFAVNHMLTPLTKEEIYTQLLDVHGPDIPLVDNIWRTLHAGEDWPFSSRGPTIFENNLYRPGLDNIRNESRSVGTPWIPESHANRLNRAMSSYAMLSKNYWDVTKTAWPLLSWYGYISPQEPQGMDTELQNLLTFGFVKPSENVPASWLTARIVHSTNLAGIYTAGDTLAEWPLNEGEGLKLHDVTENGNDVFLKAGEAANPSWVEESPGKFVMDFDGQDDIISVLKHDWFFLEDKGYIEIWVKFRSLPSGTHEIIGGELYGYNFMLNQYGNDLYVYWKSGAPSIRLYNVFEVNKWYRVGVANNDGTLTARVDELDESNGSVLPVDEDSVYIGNTVFDRIELNIGGSAYYPNWNIDGYIRDVKICASSACLQGEGGLCTDNDGDRYAIEGGICGPVDCDDSDPISNPGDSDNDGLTNCFELQIGTDHDNADTDGDGLSDYDEVCYDGNCGNYDPYPAGGDSDALNPDTDNDGILDAYDSCPLVLPVKIAGTSQHYSSLQDAYDNSLDMETILIQSEVPAGDLNINRGISAALQGGYDCNHTVKTGITLISGNIIISNGTVTIGDFEIQ